MPNRLNKETSPYLLQHANNPVDWYPFGEEAFEKARQENKPLLISIGYSACHWCHVMEHESFESAEVAAIMNAHFVNVKVDREERSDVDQLYMQAVQLMTGHGGWPLNCFVMPDGSPFYGGTYFQKTQWLNVLQSLAKLWEEQPEKVKTYASELTEGIHQSERLLTVREDTGELNKTVLHASVANWKQRLDHEEGGPNRAPKFPLPSNYQFLLRYALLENDDALLKHVYLTLNKMALGGIYDQVHGGFCRYSTDVLWKVPHFEKMLYDNAQLADLYTEAYRLTGNSLYAKTARGVLDFVAKEWYHEQGYFFSAYDADSDGVEGKYYVWTKLDLQEVLGDKFALFEKCFHIDERGYWEHDNYVLMRKDRRTEIAHELQVTIEELEAQVDVCRMLLQQEAKSRIKPGLDDKMLTSWNAMMCSAFAHAALVFDDRRYKQIALNVAVFLKEHMLSARGQMLRTYKNGKARIAGFLEDYAFFATACLDVYLLDGAEEWLQLSKTICEKALTLFENSSSVALYYTASNASELVTRTSEMADNVCPSSNSQMALNLFLLAHHFDLPNWQQRATKMVELVLPEMKNYGSAYSNWACLALYLLYPSKEVAIVGKTVEEKVAALYKSAPINTIFAISYSHSSLPLLQQRFVENETLIYVCENRACKLPVKTVEEALEQLA